MGTPLILPSGVCGGFACAKRAYGSSDSGAIFGTGNLDNGSMRIVELLDLNIDFYGGQGGIDDYARIFDRAGRRYVACSVWSAMFGAGWHFAARVGARVAAVLTSADCASELCIPATSEWCGYTGRLAGWDTLGGG